MADLYVLINEYWTSGPQLLRHVIELVEKLSQALGDEFRPVVGRLLPRMVGVLDEDDNITVQVSVGSASASTRWSS